MKIIQFFLLLLIVNCPLFIGSANAQWWSSGGNLSWPYGTVSVKKFIASDDLYAATSRMADQGNNITGLFYKTTHNWQPALRVETNMSSITNSSHILSSYVVNEFNMTSGTNLQRVVAADFANINKISGAFTWNPASWANVIAIVGTYMSSAPKGKIPWAIGVQAQINSETGAADTLLKYSGFRSVFNGGSPGNTKIQYAHSFYSSNDRPSMIYGKFYHFYGEGDYNSYFGGSITQKVYTNNVSNPPTAAELNSAFPNAVDGETIYIDDNNAGTNFYQVVKKATSWWIFTATKAL